MHLIVSEGWKDCLPDSQVEASLDEMTNFKGAALRQLSPSNGVYMKEVWLKLRVKSAVKYYTTISKLT